MLQFYTTYFAKLKSLPSDIIPISICGKAPDWYAGMQYKKLAPKYGFFMEWKKNHDNNYYVSHFNEEVLAKLNPKTVVKELLGLSYNHPVALVCYEKPSDFCHRHLVADWLTASGFSCKEYI